jgi:hypothetical protein
MEVDAPVAVPAGRGDDLYGVLMGYCAEQYPGLNEEALHHVIAEFRAGSKTELWGTGTGDHDELGEHHRLSGAALWERYKDVTSESDLHTSVRLPVDGVVARLFPSAGAAGGGGG